MNKNESFLLLNEVAAILGVKGYRITYALVNGLVPEPQRQRVSRKRLFSREDVERLATHFGVDLNQIISQKEKSNEYTRPI